MTQKKSEKINTRSYRFDLLKALAIIAIVFYHSGNLSNGYLGVEIFFPIAGYFFAQSYVKKSSNGKFKAIPFCLDKIIRLWVPILIVSLLCVILGYYTMLPDDFENLGESVVASSTFTNNILSAITTKNYWNLSNNYKPLMHMWYVGVLAQFYVAFSILFKLFDKFGRKTLKTVVYIFAFISLILYVLPITSQGNKFYYLPFRAYELLIGSSIYFSDCLQKRISKKNSFILFIIFTALACYIMIFGTPFNNNISVLIQVFITSILILIIKNSDETKNTILKVFSYIGISSYSIYIVHQPIIAFTRYLFNNELKSLLLLFVLIITAVCSILFYNIIELRIGKSLNKIGGVKSILIPTFLSIILCFIGIYTYMHAGYTRDVPELDVFSDNIHRGMHAEYVDVPYKWNNDFLTDKIHVLVIGDSMARDWCNILNESENSSNYEISYIYGSSFDETYKDRVSNADYIFYSTLGDSTEAKQCVQDLSNTEKFYVVGIKNFGQTNGQIYQKRNKPDYFKSSITLGKTNLDNGMTFEEQNIKQREYWGEHYIDMIECIRNDDGSIPVFTDTNKFISADTEHLTKNGCIYYSKIIDLSFIE